MVLIFFEMKKFAFEWDEEAHFWVNYAFNILFTPRWMFSVVQMLI